MRSFSVAFYLAAIWLPGAKFYTPSPDIFPFPFLPPHPYLIQYLSFNPYSYIVYLSNIPKNGYLRKILAHELCHCFCFSHNISMPIEQEEYLADWISLYGTDLIYLLDELMANMQIGVA
jgi:hypothetical protein